ncbi:phage tailspike protein [Serratia sp. IR-2025]|uniref:phage tailspike protein n=1 Tax=Serratia marcescens TaxID=615 RepID=UPI00356B6BA7
MPSQLFTLARSFKAAANGRIYIGKIDTDPTIPENQIQVYLENEDGSFVPMAQPIMINAGGYPVYGGQIAKFVTVEGHSMAVYDAYGAQQFYFPNVLKYDPDQFKILISGPGGAGMIGTTQGATVQSFINTALSKMLYVTPQQFGAKGDYNPVTGTGTDDTLAFRSAISAAISSGYMAVYVPAGFKYLVTDELNLGGAGYRGNIGVSLIGGGVDNTIIYFLPPASDTPLISAKGGSGTNTGRSVSNMTLFSVGESRRGIGIEVEGACFFYVDNVNIRFMNYGVRLHNNLSGQFTEFNRFSRMRIDRNNINIYYLITSGNNSFHGNTFNEIQSQILDGGYSIRVVSNSGGRAHLYNTTHNINMFGSTSGANAYAISMTMCNCDYSWANLTHEGNVIYQSTDDSWWHNYGNAYGFNGTLTFDAPVAARLGVPACFIFDNTTSMSAGNGTFTDPSIIIPYPDAYPQVFDINYSNRALSGSFPGIFRVRSASLTTVQSLAFANYDNDVLGFRFGSIPDNGKNQSFKTKWNLNTQGTVISGHNTGNAVALSYVNSSTLSSKRVIVNASSFIPGNDNDTTCGGPSNRWSVVYSATGTINTSDVKLKLFRDTKDNIASSERSAAIAIKSSIRAYQFIDALDEKNGYARFHFGVGAQVVHDILKSSGLSPDDYAFLTEEQWDDQYEDGVLVKEAGSRWGIRYDELTMFILMNT